MYLISPDTVHEVPLQLSTSTSSAWCMSKSVEAITSRSPASQPWMASSS